MNYLLTKKGTKAAPDNPALAGQLKPLKTSCVHKTIILKKKKPTKLKKSVLKHLMYLF